MSRVKLLFGILVCFAVLALDPTTTFGQAGGGGSGHEFINGANQGFQRTRVFHRGVAISRMQCNTNSMFLWESITEGGFFRAKSRDGT
jgi:hypothetical protein